MSQCIHLPNEVKFREICLTDVLMEVLAMLLNLELLAK